MCNSYIRQQSAASDFNQERQHTLANHCFLSSAVSSALCCCSRSLLVQSLPCCTASAQALGVLSMMHTTARADRKESTMQKQAGKVAWQLPYGNCAFSMASSSIVTNLAAPSDHYTCTKALGTLLLLQATPLKCGLAQEQQNVPDS